MKKLFLHIGLTKTGSTTIQEFLYQNRENLLSRGYFYPQTGMPSKLPLQYSAQHNLAWSIVESEKFDPNLGNWREVHEEIENAQFDNIIISAESFGRADKKQIRVLKSELNSYDVKIIVYLRRQDLRIESLYTQSVKGGRCSTNILSFLEKRRKRLDYYELLKPWKQIFGINNIIVRPLERTQIPNVCHDFFKIVGINDVDNFTTVNNQNVKPGMKALKGLNLAYKIASNRTKKQQQKYIRRINKYL